MAEIAVPPLGPRIRAERERRGTTVRALARDAGVSPSLVSQIETGKAQPSVSTLYAVTAALGISVEALFAIDGTVPATSPSPRAQSGTGAHLPDQREQLTLDSGVTWQRLGQVDDHHVDFLLVTYQPGGASSSDGELMRHRGTEYGYLISGELELTLGFEEHAMRPGDAVCFESSTPHRYRNTRDGPAVGVWFVVDPG